MVRVSHEFVRFALIGFSAMSIIGSGILFGRYHELHKAIDNTTKPTYCEDGDCVDRLPLSSRVRNAVEILFKHSVVGDGQINGANSRGLIEQGCKTTGGDWVYDGTDGKTCLDSWKVNKDTDYTGFSEDAQNPPVQHKNDQCRFPESLTGLEFSAETNTDFSKCIAGAAGIRDLENCGIECKHAAETTGSLNGKHVITKMSIGFFVKHFTLNGESLAKQVERYVEDHVEPMPFDGKTHLYVQNSTGALYSNMRKFRLSNNLTLSDQVNLEADNVFLRTIIRDLQGLTSEYYKFTQTGFYVLLILLFSCAGFVVICVSEVPYFKEMGLDSSTAHWVYSCCYFMSVFLTVIFFATSFSGEFHVDLYAKLDDLMVDTNVRSGSYGAEGENNLWDATDPNDPRLVDGFWSEYDQHPIIDRFGTIHTWWVITLFFTIASLTAHISTKYGPLMNLLEGELKKMGAFGYRGNDANVNARAVASKVPTGAKYLPLVSVVRT